MSELLKPLGRRLRVVDGQQFMLRSLWVPLLMAAIVQGFGRIFPIPNYHLYTWIPLLIWLPLILLFSLLRPLPPQTVARRTDRAAHLHDRLATALEIETDVGESAHFEPLLIIQQTLDARTIAGSLKPADAFPLRWSRQPLLLAAGGLLLALLLIYLPNRMDRVIAERAAIMAEAEEQAAELEELAQELAADEQLDAAERATLLRQLREAAEQLRENEGDREEALADLAKLQDTVRRQLDPQNAAERAALQGLSADLATLAGTPDQETSLDEAAKLLQELVQNSAELTPSEAQQLAGALQTAASQLAGSNAATAGALSQLASSLQNGDVSLEQLQAATDALAAEATEDALQAALAEALAQSQASARAVAAAGQAQAVGQSAGQGEGQGNGQGQGAGGQGNGQGAGTGSGNGGTTANSAPPANGNGGAADPTNPNKEFGVGDLDTVFAPQQQGQPGDPNFIPGQQSESGSELTRESANPLPGSTGASIVPYSEVFGSYSDSAAQSIERDYVPAGLKSYVRDYFSDLEP